MDEFEMTHDELHKKVAWAHEKGISSLTFTIAQLGSLAKAYDSAQERNHQHTYCSYCGQEFKADTEHATTDVGKHIWECEKHPLALLVESIEERCKDLDFVAQELLLTEDETDLSHASGIHRSIDAIRGELPAHKK